MASGWYESQPAEFKRAGVPAFASISSGTSSRIEVVEFKTLYLFGDTDNAAILYRWRWFGILEYSMLCGLDSEDDQTITAT